MLFVNDWFHEIQTIRWSESLHWHKHLAQTMAALLALRNLESVQYNKCFLNLQAGTKYWNKNLGSICLAFVNQNKLNFKSNKIWVYKWVRCPV